MLTPINMPDYDYLALPIKLCVCADGTLSMRFPSGVTMDEFGSLFKSALPAFSVDTLDMAIQIMYLIGTRRYRPRTKKEYGPTLRLTGWPSPYSDTPDDLDGAQAIMHAAHARLGGASKAPEYDMQEVPEWAREHVVIFGPDRVAA